MLDKEEEPKNRQGQILGALSIYVTIVGRRSSCRTGAGRFRVHEGLCAHVKVIKEQVSPGVICNVFAYTRNYLATHAHKPCFYQEGSDSIPRTSIPARPPAD